MSNAEQSADRPPIPIRDYEPGFHRSDRLEEIKKQLDFRNELETQIETLKQQIRDLKQQLTDKTIEKKKLQLQAQRFQSELDDLRVRVANEERAKAEQIEGLRREAKEAKEASEEAEEACEAERRGIAEVEREIEAVKAEWEKKIAAREVMVKELVEKAKRYQSSLMAMVWSVCLKEIGKWSGICVDRLIE
ncbi:uncharacterized protein [Blastocystis hominis]|uniref:Uncharacterized protein n=1 Tax=Blastocystis hominis TaxID=12968 RepID=D8M0C5_BLAHO|nr:uncharacterized protein [Blastocystis hominis]CBK21514.2 unnamed protein product [Blastocystis hominis]|eukprot:XP_012895562.1 uncharacterized protein [Blastocystis hominis]